MCDEHMIYPSVKPTGGQTVVLSSGQTHKSKEAFIFINEFYIYW